MNAGGAGGRQASTPWIRDRRGRCCSSARRRERDAQRKLQVATQKRPDSAAATACHRDSWFLATSVYAKGTTGSRRKNIYFPFVLCPYQAVGHPPEIAWLLLATNLCNLSVLNSDFLTFSESNADCVEFRFLDSLGILCLSRCFGIRSAVMSTLTRQCNQRP